MGRRTPFTISSRLSSRGGSPGFYGKIETYGKKLPTPVALPKSTVRGWVKNRQALPDSVQFNAIADFFKASRAIEDDEAQMLRELWEDACRHKAEQRSARKTSQMDEEAGDGAEEPERPTETSEPLGADESKRAIPPMTFQVQANANAQADAGSRSRWRITWIVVAVGLGVVLPTLAQAFGMPHFSPAARRGPTTRTYCQRSDDQRIPV